MSSPVIGVEVTEASDAELRGMLESPALPESERYAIEMALENRDRAARGLEPL